MGNFLILLKSYLYRQTDKTFINNMNYNTKYSNILVFQRSDHYSL